MTDFSRYIIATDMDGTFLNLDGKFVQRNLDAVERFKAGGGLFTFSTGRVHLNLRTSVGEPSRIINAPCVMSNGAYLYDFSQKKAMAESFMSEQDVQELVELIRFRYADVRFRASTADALRVERTDGLLTKDVTWYDAGAVQLSPIESWRTDDWYKIVFRAEEDVILRMREELTAHFGDRFSYTASGARFLEVQAPGVNKATGLEKLRRICGGDRVLIACGDYENDMEMLGVADLSFCPENAMPAVKKMAHRSLCHCNDGLIGDIVELLEKGEV